MVVVFGGTSGGTGGDGLLNDTWLFHLDSRQWSKVENEVGELLPSARRGCSGWLFQGRFYVLGGYTSDQWGFDWSLYCLDLNTLKWSLQPYGRSSYVQGAEGGEPHQIRPEWPGPMIALSPACVVGYHVYFFGGCSPQRLVSDPPQTNMLYRLDMKTWEWFLFEPSTDGAEYVAQTPVPRFCHGLVGVGAHLIVFGGTGAGGQTFDDAHVVEIVPGSKAPLLWHSVMGSSHERPQASNRPGCSPDTSRAFCVSEQDSLGAELNCPSPRNGFSMVVLGNKVVVFGGGVFPAEYFSETWAFDLDLPLVAPRLMLPRQSISEPLPQLPQDLELVSAGGFSIRTNRSTASRCSPFFRAMLSSGGFVEASQDRIELPDVPAFALKIAVCFMESGGLALDHLIAVAREGVKGDAFLDGAEESKPSKRGLLATDGYTAVQTIFHVCSLWGLDYLKALVEVAVLEDIGDKHGTAVPLDMAIPMLQLAKEHTAGRLELFALHSIKRNWAEICPTDEFHELDDALKKEVRWHLQSFLL